ncbi:MAG: HYExAFE family protein [Oceanicaulis sp.]
MAQRRFHYEQAFEHYLRANAIPYVAVDEAKRALSAAGGPGRHNPPAAPDTLGPTPGGDASGAGSGATPGAISGGTSGGGGGLPHKLKSFDFVVYSRGGSNLLVDVKGRKHTGRSGRSLQNWVTRDDVTSLSRWGEIFGDGFESAFAFLFWCEAQPPDALFQEVFAYGDRWYAVLAVRLSDYAAHQRERSARWGTVSVPAAAFDTIAHPLSKLL